MKKSDIQQLETIKARLIEGMTDYIADGDDSYTKADIRKCDKILQQLMARLGKLDDSMPESAILDYVKKAVLDLNALNGSFDGCLIETDQREDLCEYLLLAARSSGLASDKDITEEWREW
jgi:hypothetical protein